MKKPKINPAFGVFVALVFLVCVAIAPVVEATSESITGVQTDPVAMFRADPQHSGSYTNGGLTPAGTLLWGVPVPDVSGDPVVVNGIVYVGNRSGSIFAFDAETGTLVWKNDLWQPPVEDDGYQPVNPYAFTNTSTTPLVASGVVDYYWNFGFLNCLDEITAPDGSFVKDFTAPFHSTEARTSPVLIDAGQHRVAVTDSHGTVWVNLPISGNSKLFASPLFSAGDIALSSPAYHNGNLFFSDSSGNVYKIDAMKETTIPVWKTPMSVANPSSPMIARGGVWLTAGTTASSLYGLDEITGRSWQYPLGSCPASSVPVVDPHAIYATDECGHVMSMLHEDGSILRSDLKTPIAPSMSLSVADGVIYIGTTQGDLIGLDNQTLQEKWRYKVPAPISSSLVITKGLVYFTTSDGHLYAVGRAKSTPPVIEWQKSFGGSQTDFGEFVVRTANNGIILGGVTSSSDGDLSGKGFHGFSDIVLAKYENANSLEWTRVYGGYDGISTVRQIQTLSDGYLVAGESYATNGDLSGHHGTNQTSDIWLLRLDNSGNKVWSKSYGGSSFDVAMWIENTPDNGFVITGFTYSTDGDFAGLRTTNQSCDAFVMKIDNAGAIQWKKVYGGTKNDEAVQIELSPDKTRYYVTGMTWSNDGNVANKNHGGDSGTADGWVYAIDLDGNLLWSRCYGGSGEELFWGMDTDTTGAIVVTGSTKSSAGDQQIPQSKHGLAGSSDVWYLRLDSSGNIISNQCFGGSRDDDGQSIRVTSDGDIFILGSTRSNDGDVMDKHGGSDTTSDLWLIKTDRTGNIIWQNCYGGSDDDWGMRFDVQVVDEMINNGYVIGTTTSIDGDVSGDHGLGDIWVVRVGTTNEETLW